MMLKWLTRLSAAALVLLCMAGVAQASSVTGVTLPDLPARIDQGERITIRAVVEPEDAVVTSVEWRSSRTEFATVKKMDDRSCTITGKRMGRTILYVRVNKGKPISRVITVTYPRATAIRLNRTALTLNPAGSASSTYTLTTKTAPTYHSDTITWKSSDDSVASISPSADGKSCVVTAVSDGSEVRTCTITATTDKGQRQAICTVTVKKIPEKYVRVPSSLVVPLKSERPLTYAVYPANAFDQKVTFEVIKNRDVVASADPNTGVIKGLKSGTAVVRVTTANGRSAKCLVTVKSVRYSGFSVSPSSRVIEKGAQFDITHKIKPAFVSYPGVNCASSNTAVATVDFVPTEDPDDDPVKGKWVVTGVSRGYATITVSGDNGRVKRYIPVRVIDNTQPIEITVSAVGDVMLGGDPRKFTYKYFDSLWNDKGPTYFFEKIRDAIKNGHTDIAFANLEIPLINTSRIIQGSRNNILRGKTKYAQALKYAGFDTVDIDNNHIMDYGYVGYASTKAALSAQGISSFGRGTTRFITRKGVKIGFAGYRPENISITRMKADIRAIRKKCDIVIASFHWGVEGYVPSAEQRAYGRAAVQAGAQLVVGHHTHVVSGIEQYTYKETSGIIVYGLGTIVSVMKRPSDVDTLIYRHTFSVTGSTVTNVRGEIVPVHMTTADKDKRNDAQPVLAEGAKADAIINKIARFSPGGKLPSIISGYVP